MKQDLYTLSIISRTKTYQINKPLESKTANPQSNGESKRGSESPLLGCRHIVAFLGFAVFVFLNIHRMNMTVSIVTMMKDSVSTKGLNRSLESCPSLASEMKNNSTLSFSKKTEGEFDWTPELQGYILGSSFLGYCLTLLAAGKLSEIFGCKWIIFWGVLLSSVATFVTPFVSWWNVYILIAVQTIRGMAQGKLEISERDIIYITIWTRNLKNYLAKKGVFQASLSVLGANWFPAAERGSLFAFMLSGNGAGMLSGGLITGYLCQAPHLGWPVVFYSCGAAGVIFAFIVAIFLFENPSVHPRISAKELKFILSNQENKLSQKRPSTPWRSIFTSVPVYALSFAAFGQFWGAVHFLAIHPTFLGTILHFPISQNGLLTSMPFLLQTVFTIIASLLSKVLNKNKFVCVSKVRKFWNFLSCLGYSLCLVGIYFAECNRMTSVTFSFLAVACLGLAFAGCMIVPADMTPTFAGSVMGVTCTIGATAAFILPFVAGWLTDGMQTFEQWSRIIFISIGVVMSSGIAFCIFGSAEIQSWNDVEDKNPVDAKKEMTLY